MPRLSKENAVREMMRQYGQAQSFEAIQQYTDEHSSGPISWPDLSKMVDAGEVAAVDAGANGKGGRLTMYGPGPQLAPDDDQDQAAPEPAETTAEASPPTGPND